nr:hypothetical protein [Tanacetum cinerariifolium]
MGLTPSYKTWIHHGEADLPPPPLVIDNIRPPQMSDMTACLNELSYIPLNNEQNEPTQGDIGETSNDLTQAKRNEFEELYASTNEELYPGCDYVTRLDFMAKFIYFKAKGKLTDSIFNEMLEFFQNVFPIAKGYKLPPSYYAIKKTFKTIGLGLQRLYNSSHTAKEITWHATGKCTEPGKMQHPIDGKAWKDFDTKYLDFAAEPRNVRLGLAADGFNPFGNLSQSYSMWPVILTTYNLPPWLCMKESYFMLTLLIPGLKSPGKDIDVYLRPLSDDLKVLWAKPGVETIDVATGLKFNMRAMVLWTINDFPARSSLFGWSGQGYKACPTCNEDTPSVRVLGKTSYVGHRRFLKKPHKCRRSLEFNGETENRDPPREFSRDAIMTQLARLHMRVKGKHPRWKDSNTQGKKVPKKVLRYFLIIPRLQRLYKSSHTAKEMTWHATRKCTEPGKMQHPIDGKAWKDLDTKYSDFAAELRNVRLGLAADGFNPFDNLNVMHIEKNVLEGILNTLLMNDKSKDTTKARQDLKRLGIPSGLWLGQNKNEKWSKPQVAYSFTPEDKKKFCQFIKGVKLPDGFGSKFKHKDTDNDINIAGLKSHDYHIMMQRLLPYGLHQYLAPDVAKPLIELCLFFKQICSQTLMVDDMLKAHSKVIDILCNLELIYPPFFFDIMIHLVIHLPLEAIFGGLIRPRWMYPFERYIKKLKNYVRNKAKPEGSIAEGYVAKEALTFSSYYFRDVTMKFNRPDRNVDCPPPTCQLQVFKSLCKSIGLRSVIRIDHQELKKVIWYVLHNSPEIDTYRAKFKMYIRQRHVDNDPGVNESSELFALACGPSQTPISVNSCVVNGVRFVVHSRDERRTTQNSGICSPGPDGEMYYEDMARRSPGWKVVEHVSHKKFLNGGFIVVEDDPDVIHVDNSSDLTLSTSLNDLEIVALHIDGQSIDVDAPPDIIDVVDEDDDIIDEEDPIPYDLADSDDED